MAVTVTKNGDTFTFSGRAKGITKAKNKALEPYGCIVHDYGIVLELLPDEKQKQNLAGRSEMHGLSATVTGMTGSTITGNTKRP